MIDRSRRQIALTDAGLALLPRACSLLDQADHLIDGLTAPATPKFRLVVPRSIESAALARLVQLLHDQQVDAEIGSEDDHERQSGAGWWIERTTEQAADWIVDLGVMSGEEGGRPDRPRWLGDLRPRRGRAARELLITEDDDTALVDTIRELADRSGLSPRLIRRTSSDIARAELLADRAMVITSRRTAEQSGLAWSRLADPGLKRWFRLIERPPIPAPLVAGELREHVLAMLGIVLGAERSGPDDHAREDHWGRP